MYGKTEYGKYLYGLNEFEDDIEMKNIDLMKYLPDYWHEIDTMKELQRVLGIEIVEILKYKTDIIKQLYIETATWGLDRWEKIFGLKTDVKKTFEFRRERIKTKIRGSGTTTKQMIINVASSFAGGEVNVIEYARQNKFIVKFVGVKGVPANMTDLTIAIEEIKPAHLTFAYEYTYNYWNNIKNMIWDNLEIHTWDIVEAI